MNKHIKELMMDTISRGHVDKASVKDAVEKIALGKNYGKLKKTKKTLDYLKNIWR